VHYGVERSWGARVDDGWSYRGVAAVVIENELLRAVVLAGKGADLMSLVHKPSDTEYLWRSPWGVRDPARSLPSSGDPAAVWLDHYEGGWQSVFPNGGLPARYRGAELGQHAEANLLPWDVQVLEEGPERAEASFRVRLARTPLEATKRVWIEAGRATLGVAVEVVNEGKEAIDLVYGEHIAFGAPFLSEHCVIDLPGGLVRTHPSQYSPHNRLKAGTATPWPTALSCDGEQVDLRKVLGPDAKADDQAYIGDLVDGWYAVTNVARGVGLAVRFPHELLRYLWYWQMFGGGSGYPWWGRTYNIGLEPFTSWPNLGLEEAIANGSAARLAPGGQMRAELKVTAFTSRLGAREVSPDATVTTIEEDRIGA
jgi:hypothetical protein